MIHKFNNKKLKILLLFFTIFGFCFITTKEIKAGVEHNVYGWAWSENIGWISFNNIGTKDYQNNDVPAGGGTIDYGVNIEEGGNLTGYAWSENIGWIHFDPQGPYPENPSYSAKVDLETPNLQIKGWARVCSVFQTGCSGALNSNRGNWDGWIKMNDSFNEPWIDMERNPAEFRSYVWGGNPDNDAKKSVIGWGTFNCLEGSSSGQSVCGLSPGQSNYKVVTTFRANWPPTASDLEVNRPECNNFISFSWNYNDQDDDNESKFDFQVSSTSFDDLAPSDIDLCSVCEINRIGVEANYPSGSQNSQSVNVSPNPAANSLTYGKTYYWRVRVYDINGSSSAWIEGDSFSTRSFQYPIPEFSTDWPNNTSVWVNRLATVNLTNSSTCYDSDNICNSYKWNFGDSTPVNTEENPTHTYTSSDQSTKEYNVSLEACDEISCCSTNQTLKIKNPLDIPNWKEISPF